MVEKYPPCLLKHLNCMYCKRPFDAQIDLVLDKKGNLKDIGKVHFVASDQKWLEENLDD